MKAIRYILCAVIISLIGQAGISFAAEPTAQENNIKAAILFNLIRFSVWPVSDAESFNLCTISDENMRGALDGLKGKTVHGVPLSITHLDGDETNERDCQVLYSSESLDDVPLRFEDIHRLNTLTVGDDASFVDAGGCMSIQRHGNKMKFSINRLAIKSANIRPSSKILRLAVKTGGEHD